MGWSSSRWYGSVMLQVDWLTWWEDGPLAGWQGDGWYFWDETGAYCVGPFDTKDEATKAAKDYLEKLEA